MKKNEMVIIHDIIIETVKLVPKAWDMHHQKFNCDCHLELTEETYHKIGEKLNSTPEEAIMIVEDYFNITNGYV